MEIKRSGSQPSNKGPADWFTGTVRIDPLFQASDPARVAGASVTFEPGARTAWHAHPLGQTLIVTAGLGWAQRWGGPIEEIRPGDVVWFPPNEKHWHGATPTTAMTHIAIQEAFNGKVVDWMEQVSDEQYRRSWSRSDSQHWRGIQAIVTASALNNRSSTQAASTSRLCVRQPRPSVRYAPASSSRVFPECRLPQSGMIPLPLHLFEICVEALNGKVVEWMEKVSDQQYQKGK